MIQESGCHWALSHFLPNGKESSHEKKTMQYHAGPGPVPESAANDGAGGIVDATGRQRHDCGAGRHHDVSPSWGRAAVVTLSR